MFYPVVFDEEGPTVIASLPDLPGTHDEGASRTEALERLCDAALVMIQSLIDDREEVPEPSPAEGRPLLALPSQVWTKVLLYQTLRRKQWRKADLARALGIDQKGADRLLNLCHASRSHQIDAAFKALGTNLVPAVREVAYQQPPAHPS
ncbi:antitoxin HicB [uncultured Gammaproteobacteria bacterium]